MYFPPQKQHCHGVTFLQQLMCEPHVDIGVFVFWLMVPCFHCAICAARRHDSFVEKWRLSQWYQGSMLAIGKSKQESPQFPWRYVKQLSPAKEKASCDPWGLSETLGSWSVHQTRCSTLKKKWSRFCIFFLEKDSCGSICSLLTGNNWKTILALNTDTAGTQSHTFCSMCLNTSSPPQNCLLFGSLLTPNSDCSCLTRLLFPGNSLFCILNWVC